MADGVTSTAVYRRQIEASEPELHIETFEVNNEGLVNDVVIVNGARVFRFAKEDWAMQHMWQEVECLALARQHVTMRLPRLTVYDGELVGFAFVGYDFIPGVALQRYQILRLPEREQDALAEQLGTFLHQLHTIPIDEAQARGVKPSVTVRTAGDWLQLYDDTQRELFPLLMPFARDWVHQHFAPLMADNTWLDYQPAFMNGDLASYHLLYQPETRRLNGVIDFGTAGLGDPACDFGCLIDQYGESFVRRLGRYYAGLDDLIERARFWAGTLELQWALGGLRQPEDPAWFFVHIGRARDVLPIGSGWPAASERQ
jgi:aminoglycoside 2''-phosphotransferase